MRARTAFVAGAGALAVLQLVARVARAHRERELTLDLIDAEWSAFSDTIRRHLELYADARPGRPFG